MKRVHLIISGHVQGVGFRSWVVGQAKDLHLVGWAKNREDGAVEIVAEGDSVEEFVTRCHTGPVVSSVEQVDVRWAEATGEFVDFGVIY